MVYNIYTVYNNKVALSSVSVLDLQSQLLTLKHNSFFDENIFKMNGLSGINCFVKWIHYGGRLSICLVVWFG